MCYGTKQSTTNTQQTIKQQVTNSHTLNCAIQSNNQQPTNNKQTAKQQITHDQRNGSKKTNDKQINIVSNNKNKQSTMTNKQQQNNKTTKQQNKNKR